MMKYKIEKNGNSVNFINIKTNDKFNYIEFADKLYDGEQLEITNYGILTEEEKKAIDQTVKELNDLANPRKRKRIISQLDLE